MSAIDSQLPPPAEPGGTIDEVDRILSPGKLVVLEPQRIAGDVRGRSGGAADDRRPARAE